MNRWIFLRGWTRDARHWGDFPELFRRVVPDAAVTLVDLPGNGALHGMSSPTCVGDMVEHCRQSLSRQGMPPPYHLLSLSLGGMVAAAWSTRYPAEIGGCVLINTSLRPFSPFYQRLRPRNYPVLLTLLLPAPHADRQERLILRLTSARRAAQADVLAAWIAYARECPVTHRNALRQLRAAARYVAPAGKPAAPVLVLASAGDQLVDPRCSQSLARAWHCVLRVHADAGHDIPLDDGLWVAAQVRDWLRGIREGDAPNLVGSPGTAS